MGQAEVIRQFWQWAAILTVVLGAGCSHKATPAKEKFKPSPTLTRHVTFVQWTDPHVFDAGKGRHAEGVREEELDNWAAFHWAVLETNRLALVEHRDINFVAITGDFGLENVNLPAKDRRAAEGCASPNPEKNPDKGPAKEGPINRVELAEAATRVARELDALVVKRVYLVPGNNDLCNEDPRDLHRWAEFVFELQTDLKDLHQARHPSVPANAQNNPSEDKGSQGKEDQELDKVEVYDLTDSLDHLCNAKPPDPRVKAFLPKGQCPPAQGPYVINGIHLLGLDSAFFKNHKDDDDKDDKGKTIQSAADTAIPEEIKLVKGGIQSGSAYLLFTHIPDLKDPFKPLDTQSSWYLEDDTLKKNKVRDNWKKNILGRTEVLGVFAGHFHISDRTLYPHNFVKLTSDDTTAAKFWLAPPLAGKYQFRSPPDKTARGMLLVSVNADGDARVSGEEGEIIQPSAIWYATADQKAAVTGDEKLAQARAAELDGEWEKAAASYATVLTDPSVDAHTRTTAYNGYWHAHEVTTKWWWQSRIARWLYLDGLPVLYSAGLVLPLLVAICLVGLAVYAVYSGLKWLIRRYKVGVWVFKHLVSFHGRALITPTVQLTVDAPDKEFAARLRAEGEAIKKLLLEEKESWAASHVTLLTPAGSSFDQLVGSIPKVDMVAVSEWVKFFVNLMQTFRWTVQSGIAVFPPNQPTGPAPAAGSDKLVPGSEVAAYAVLQWAWIVRNSWHSKLDVTNDRTALSDLARELAELILGEAFV
jgi:3',5'-cyclic AMP phosphodiesterase CpdA